MARIISPVWSIIRGSIGGITYLSNQFHQIVARARTAPVQPNTNAQTLIRGALEFASDAWLGLTEAAQTAWDLFARGTPFSGPLGPYTVPGRQMFIAGCSLSSYISASGFAVTELDTTPPIGTGFLTLKNVRPVAPTGPGTGIAVSIGADTLADCACLVEISRAFTTARKRFKGPWDISKCKAVIIPQNSTVLVEFLGLEEAAVYFTRVKAVADNFPCRISAAFINRHVAETIAPPRPASSPKPTRKDKK